MQVYVCTYMCVHIRMHARAYMRVHCRPTENTESIQPWAMVPNPRSPAANSAMHTHPLFPEDISSPQLRCEQDLCIQSFPGYAW